MNRRTIHVLIFVLGVTALLVQSLVLQRRSTEAGAATRPAGSEERAPIATGEGGAEKRPDSDSPAAESHAGGDDLPMTPPQRWQALAGVTFKLLDPKSLELPDLVGELLDLDPAQTKALQGALSTFLDEVRAEELKNAYVRVKGDGSQEVVVAPFDRGPILKTFRDAVAAKLGADVGDFCAREALYDSTLAVGNKEVRIYTLRGLTEMEAKLAKSGPPGSFRETMKDRERLMVSRGVHRKGFTGRPEWEGEAAPPAESTLSNTDDYGPRYRHLHEAKGRLPRKSE